jgi:nucleoside-diphosphate-sugar epimerase
MKNILVLGSSGQIGAYLTEHLRDRGYEVTEYDKVLGPQYNLCAIPSSFLESCIKKADFVFFLAFDVGGSRYLKKYQHTFSFIDNNARMMVNVFGLLEKYNKKFVFASSQMSNMGYSPYGAMKKAGELYTESLGGLIVKFWNVYGIEKDYEKSHVITDFIKRGFEEGEFEMLTDGTEERQFLYAEDCCEALETVMLKYNDFKPTDPLHITSFSSRTIKDVAQIIQGQFNIIGKSVRINPGEAKDTVQLDKRNEANTFITGWWLPKTSLEEGITKVFEEMKNDWV